MVNANQDPYLGDTSQQHESHTATPTVGAFINSYVTTPSVATQQFGNAFLPTGVLASTLPRWVFNGGVTSNLATGQPWLVSIFLDAGVTIRNISFLSGGTAASAPTHQWFGLYDNNRVQLAVTSDDLTTAWGANAIKTLPIATTAAGAASSFTTTYSGLHYVGAMVAATTPPSVIVLQTSAVLLALAPVFSVLSSESGQTTPPAFPHTVPTGTNAIILYAHVS